MGRSEIEVLKVEADKEMKSEKNCVLLRMPNHSSFRRQELYIQAVKESSDQLTNITGQ